MFCGPGSARRSFSVSQSRVLLWSLYFPGIILYNNRPSADDQDACRRVTVDGRGVPSQPPTCTWTQTSRYVPPPPHVTTECQVLLSWFCSCSSPRCQTRRGPWVGRMMRFSLQSSHSTAPHSTSRPTTRHIPQPCSVYRRLDEWPQTIALFAQTISSPVEQ